METKPRKPYPTDVTDEEWAFVAPYLTLMTPDAPQRRYDRREVFNALRWIERAGAPWRMLPTNFPPWEAVYQQTQRWLAAGCFEAMMHDLRALLRWAEGRADAPTAAILDSRTAQSSPESGARASYDGHKRRKGSKLHLAVDTLGHLLALRVTPAAAQDRDQVASLAAAGLGKRAGAQQDKPIWASCNAGDGGAILRDVDLGDEQNGDDLPCGGNEECPQDRVCVALLNPGGRLNCRCVQLA